jgi:hypothetical protein
MDQSKMTCTGKLSPLVLTAEAGKSTIYTTPSSAPRCTEDCPKTNRPNPGRDINIL